MIYLHYNDQTGAVIRAYHDSVSNIPEPYITVDDLIWSANMEKGNVCTVVDGEAVFSSGQPPPPPGVADNRYMIYDDDRNKLDSIQIGAEVNAIEHIYVNNVELPIRKEDRSVSFNTGTYWLESH